MNYDYTMRGFIQVERRNDAHRDGKAHHEQNL